MVRAAVRTLTLSVYRVREPSLERFLLGMFLLVISYKLYDIMENIRSSKMNLD